MYVEEKIPIEDQDLYLDTRLMQDEDKLNDFKIQNGVYIRLVIKKINIVVEGAYGNRFQCKVSQFV